MDFSHFSSVDEHTDVCVALIMFPRDEAFLEYRYTLLLVTIINTRAITATIDVAISVPPLIIE